MNDRLKVAASLDEENFNIKIAPTEKADLVKFLTEGFSISPDYPDHKAPELPKRSVATFARTWADRPIAHTLASVATFPGTKP